MKTSHLFVLSFAALSLVLAQDEKITDNATTAAVASTNQTVTINWDLINNSDENYQSISVGGKIEFVWNETSVTPSIFYFRKGDENCAQFGANITQLVSTGDDVVPPVTFTVTEESLYEELIFAGEITNINCVPDGDDILTVAVAPSEEDRPTEGICASLEDSLDTCLRDGGVRAVGRTACRACIRSAFTGGTIRLGGGGCIDDTSTVCEAFTSCPCDECYFEAAAWGSCNIDESRADSCPITNCSEEVGEASDSSTVGMNESTAAFVATLFFAAAWWL